MAITVTLDAPTDWSLTAQEICADALEHMGALASGETMSAADLQTALRALNAVLKELPLHGYVWPKLSGETALLWEGQSVALPADYYGFPVVCKTVEGQRVGLTQIPHATWIAMPDRFTATGEPTHFYVSPDSTLYFYPSPTVDPVAYVQYQRIVEDASATVDVLQTLHNALGYGVANELAMKYGVPQSDRMEIATRWADKLNNALKNAVPNEPIEFSVAD
jgi:hypothetical protein